MELEAVLPTVGNFSYAGGHGERALCTGAAGGDALCAIGAEGHALCAGGR